MNEQKRAQKASDRLTLYVKPHHRDLLQWVQEHTEAKSLSEAVFLALSELKDLIRERRLQALEKTHGIWRDDPEIEIAVKELEESWDEWRKQLEES